MGNDYHNQIEQHKMRIPMNTTTSFIAFGPPKGPATKTADAQNAQAQRTPARKEAGKHNSRDPEVSPSRPTRSSRSVGTKFLSSSYQVTQPLSNEGNRAEKPFSWCKRNREHINCNVINAQSTEMYPDWNYTRNLNKTMFDCKDNSQNDTCYNRENGQ